MNKKMPARDAYLVLGLMTVITLVSLVLFYLVWFRDLSVNQLLLSAVAFLAIDGALALAVLRMVSPYRKSN